MEAWCPDGYVAFSSLAEDLYCQGGLLEQWDTKNFSMSKEFRSAMLSNHLELINSNGSMNRSLSRLEDRLIVEFGLFWLPSGKVRVAGFDLESNVLLQIPTFSWLYSKGFNGPSDYNDRLIADLLLGHSMAIPSLNDGFIICRPVIELRSLAAALDASKLPPEPAMMPIEWEAASATSVRTDSHLPISTSEPLSNAAAAAGHWMEGYALAMKNMGIKPKRDDTLRLCQQRTRCTSRQAKVAWNALPADWKGHPRRSPDADGPLSARRPLGVR
jgi:hypothetical protein